MSPREHLASAIANLRTWIRASDPLVINGEPAQAVVAQYLDTAERLLDSDYAAAEEQVGNALAFAEIARAFMNGTLEARDDDEPPTH